MRHLLGVLVAVATLLTAVSPSAAGGHDAVHWTSAARKRVDDQFCADMRSRCASRSWYDKPTCHAWSTTFHRSVRVVGGP